MTTDSVPLSVAQLLQTENDALRRENREMRMSRNMVADDIISERQISGLLRVEVQHWKANHTDMVNRAAILAQREDLPVDRLPAFREMARLQARVAELTTALAVSRDAVKVLDKRIDILIVRDRKSLTEKTLSPIEECHEDDGNVLLFHFENFEEPPAVHCGSILDVAFDPEYWTHFIPFDFNHVMYSAEMFAAIAVTTKAHPVLNETEAM
ncbi:MAG: hypothetical protein Q7S87_16150 [Agitococcus sp.]|nr:hypothetical protein [Agitococcus sp.]